MREESLATFLAAGSSLLALVLGLVVGCIAPAALEEAADRAESLAIFLAAGSSLLVLVLMEEEVAVVAAPAATALLAESLATFLAAGSSLLVLAARDGALATDCESTASFGIPCNTLDDVLPAFLVAGSAAALMDDAPGAVAAVPEDVCRACGGDEAELLAMIAWILFCFSCGVSDGSCIIACIALRDSEICGWPEGAGAVGCVGWGADCCRRVLGAGAGAAADVVDGPAGAGEPPAMIS